MSTVMTAIENTPRMPCPSEVPLGAVPPLEGAELADAFEVFSAAAKSLERSYFSLGQEVSRLRAELQQERDLRRRREALAEISALLAHEVRNPLASMELFAGLLAGSVLGEEEREWVEQIQAALRILSATVSNILEFHHQRPLDLDDIDVNGLLESVRALLAPVAYRARVRWIADLAPEPLWIRGDRHRLSQVFLNLALNAFRFAAQGEVLRVHTRRKTSCVLVTFEDKGPGIPLELQDKILKDRVTTCGGGSGLGLAVAKQIVEQHGGHLSFLSVLGGGASFELEFPTSPGVGR